VDEISDGGRPAVLTEIRGSAYRTGEHTFTLDPDDPLGVGFQLR
jgi:proline racemase